MANSRQHDNLEALLETRVIILEISSRFAAGRSWTATDVMARTLRGA
jgi:hypothetical protein